MSERHQLAKHIEDDAIQWLARLNSPQLTDAEEQAFMRWLEASPLHQAAYINAEELWQRGAVLAQVRKPNTGRAAKPGLPFAAWQGWALAGSAVLVVALGWLLKPVPDITHSYQTAMGEQKEFLLEDGSRIELNTNSKLDITLSGKQRRAHLVQGEAFFAVQKDGRSFEVKTREGEVHVLGTRFAVQQTASDTLVTVSEGKVALGELKDETFTANALLQANERLSLQAAKAGQTPEKINSNSALAWRNKQLVFRAQSLNQVIAELSRYYPDTIVLQEPEQGAREITAVIQLTDITSTLNQLGHPLGLVAISDPANQRVTLQKKP